MAEEKIFRTKTGYCHVLEDKIVLTRDGAIGKVAAVSIGNNIARPLIIYGIIAITLLLLSCKGFQEGDPIRASLFVVLGVFLIANIIRSRHNSATPVIDREKIKNIEFKQAITGATRAYFIIYFETDRKQIKRRYIFLPGSLNNGALETEKALQIMTEEFG